MAKEAEHPSTSADLPLLFYGDSYRFPDIYHLTRFLAPDAFITLEHAGEIVMLTNSLEQGRAEKESRASRVRNVDELGQRELSAQGVFGDDATATIIERLLREQGLTSCSVPRYFPIALADRLRAQGLELAVAVDLDQRRRTKRPDEIAALEAAQRATEEAWELGVAALRRAEIAGDGGLRLDGDVFTAERLRAIVESALLERGCIAESTIIAPGTQAADPHQIGTGPLRARVPIVMDIFPQDKRSRYYADMTRTVSRGEPSPEIVRMYEVVMRAQDAGMAALRPGSPGVRSTSWSRTSSSTRATTPCAMDTSAGRTIRSCADSSTGQDTVSDSRSTKRRASVAPERRRSGSATW